MDEKDTGVAIAFGIFVGVYLFAFVAWQLSEWWDRRKWERERKKHQ